LDEWTEKLVGILAVSSAFIWFLLAISGETVFLPVFLIHFLLSSFLISYFESKRKKK